MSGTGNKYTPNNHLRLTYTRSLSATLSCTASLSEPDRRSHDRSSHAGSIVFGRTVSLLLAGSVTLNTLAPALLLPAAYAAPTLDSTAAPETTLTSLERAIQPTYDISEAPSIHADVQAGEQQQWWQQDQQVWLELVSAAEVESFLSSSTPPPSWPALSNTSLAPKLRLLEFYASWCPACKAAAPGMAELAGEPSLRSRVTFARVNVDRVKQLARQLGVTKIPTVMIIGPDGAVLDTFRAAGQVARDALQVHLAALGAAPEPPPLLPPLPPPEELPAPSGVDSSTGSNGGSNGGSNSGSNDAGAACGVTPEPSCGGLPPGVAAADTDTSATPHSSSSSTAAAGDTAASGNSSSSGGADADADAGLQAAKQSFLRAAGSAYGYGGWLDQHYEVEVGRRLGPGKHYLDYTGAALYPSSLLAAVYEDLLTHTYGNPHSAAPAPPLSSTTTNNSSSSSNTGTPAAIAATAASAAPAEWSESVLESARAAVLSHLHADPADYQVVFTRSATDALRMVGEMFPWAPGASSSSSSVVSSSNTSTALQATQVSQLDMLAPEQTNQQQQQQVPSGAEPSSSSGSSGSSSSSGSGSDGNSHQRSQFIYTRSNHNSVLGIGAYAAAAGAELVPMGDEDMEAWLMEQQQQQQSQPPPTAAAAMAAVSEPTYHLVAYPAEDNFAGVIYPLDWIKKAHSLSSPSARYVVLLDAAAFLPSHPLDLSAHPADLLVTSFYKMFGYPTGLGALVIRTDLVPHINKVYFGGGSVALSTPEGCWHVSKCDPSAALSDGTPNYLGAAALNIAYDTWDKRGGVESVSRHTQVLSSWLLSQLNSLQHHNGAPLIHLYGRHNNHKQQQLQGSAAAAAAGGDESSGFSQGAVFNFQVLQPDGSPISFSRVERDAAAAGLFLRSGCVCNPGACYDALGLEASEVQGLAGLKEGCGDEMDFITVMRPPAPQAPGLATAAPATAAAATGASTDAAVQGSSWWRWGVGAGSVQEQQQEPQEQGGLEPTQVPLGSVRASLGWASTFEDVYALVQFLRGYLS